MDESRKRLEGRQLDLGRLVGAWKARARTEIGGYRGIHRALPAGRYLLGVTCNCCRGQVTLLKGPRGALN